MAKNWKTLYECPCGNIITNEVGNFDRYFFLDPVCEKCGEDKSQFVKKGIGYWIWTPTFLNWVKGKWVLRELNETN